MRLTVTKDFGEPHGSSKEKLFGPNRLYTDLEAKAMNDT